MIDEAKVIDLVTTRLCTIIGERIASPRSGIDAAGIAVALAEGAIETYKAALVAAGYVIVPREPDRAMLVAAYATETPGPAGAEMSARDCWIAMIEAAPK